MEFASMAGPVSDRLLSGKFSIFELRRVPWFSASSRCRRISVPKTHLIHTRVLMKAGISVAAKCSGGNEVLGPEVAAVNQLSSKDIKSVENLDDLPLSLKGGMTVESWGFLYEGPDEEKYWSSSHRKYPYPIGYKVTKLYKHKLFRQVIKKGNGGPLFVITVGKHAFSADTPGRAWAYALSALPSSGNEIGIKKVCGARYFGFENPLVLQKLEEMVKQYGRGIARHTVANDEMEERSTGNGVRVTIGNAAGSSIEEVSKRKGNESRLSSEDIHNQRIEGHHNKTPEGQSSGIIVSVGSAGYKDLNPKLTKEMQLGTQEVDTSALTVNNHKIPMNDVIGDAESLVDEGSTSIEKSVMVINDAESGTNTQECVDGKGLQATEQAITPEKAHLEILIADKRSESVLELLRGMVRAGSEIDVSDYEIFFPFMFDVWQKQAIEKIRKRKSVLLCAPDGTGKSAVAKCCLIEEFIKNQRTMFVTPYQIQAKQHFQEFEKCFGGNKVSGDWQSPKVQRNSMVLVVTLGSLIRLFREGSPIIEGITLVVLDKFDTICNPAHGSYWEELLMLLNPQISVLALSMLVDNAVYVVSWMDSIHKHCELVISRAEPVPKKYLVFDGSISELVNLVHTQTDKKSTEISDGVSDLESGRDEFGSPTFSLMDKSTAWRCILSCLQKNKMLPSILILSEMDDMNDCRILLEHSCKVFSGGLLSDKELANVKDHLKKFAGIKPSISQFVGGEDHRGLLLGIATYRNDQLPIWQEFVLELINNNLVKLVIASKNLILQTEIRVQTVVLCGTLKPYKLDLSLLTPSDFLKLRSLAGRRGNDRKGNIIFMQTPRSNPKQLLALAFQNSMSISSVFKPSYSLLLNLLARYGCSMSKNILNRTLSEYAPSNSVYKKMRKVEQVEYQIIECQRKKLELEWTLFQNLSNANKRKLEHATLYTLVDILRGGNDGLQVHTTLTGVLLAVVPGPSDLLYLVLTNDNIYRLMPAGAFNHVYETNLPLDKAHKLLTGEDLDPPCLPSKNCWQAAVGGDFGYIAGGNATSVKIAKAVQMHMVHHNLAKEGDDDLRRQIQTMTKEISCLQKNMDMLLSEEKPSLASEVSSRRITKTWKESERLTKILQEAGAIIREEDGDCVQIKPFGKLISQLHYMENELWIATILTSSIWNHLTPPEFAGLCSTFLGKEYIIETFISKEIARIYKYPKSIHDAIENLHSLRKQVVSLQKSENPPVNYDTSEIGLVHAWARAKPDNKEFKLSSINDGSTAWKLRRVAQVLIALHQTCKKCVNDDTNSWDFLTLSRVGRRAAHLLTRHNFVNGIL